MSVDFKKRSYMFRQLAFLLFFFVSAPSAMADPMYFGRTGPISLPNGKIGIIYELLGRQTIGPTPVRLLMADENGVLIAVGPRDFSWMVSCNAGVTQCWGYDPETNQILEPDPKIVKADYVLIGKHPEQIEEDFLQKNREIWGFKQRQATAADIIASSPHAILSTRAGAYFNAFLGIVAGAILARSASRALKEKSPKRRAISIILAFLYLLPILFIVWIMNSMFATHPALTLICFAVIALFVFAIVMAYSTIGMNSSSRKNQLT